ncbi:MAG: DUF2309 domain-containing protein [Bacteroidetes bacterium]|nr:DUF2309 domain-containing protein [Bacteroidota bacterium]
MKKQSDFNEHKVLHRLSHYLPAQAPLKDFIHHNTLHAFQHLPFDEALRQAEAVFGYKTSLSVAEYRNYYQAGEIDHSVLEDVLLARKGSGELDRWMHCMLEKHYETNVCARIGQLRSRWRDVYRLDLDSRVHPRLFRILCSYLDQGIAIHNFPVHEKGLLSSLRILEKSSFTSFFSTARVRSMLLEGHCGLAHLLKIVVGDAAYYERYLFDQQFAHQGWSGMVAAIELQPETLIDRKPITLHDLIVLELLLEIDCLDQEFGVVWAPVATGLDNPLPDLFASVPQTEAGEVLSMWQEALEWTYYRKVLGGIKSLPAVAPDKPAERKFQAVFCIDDRECSLRRYIEQQEPACETFGTPGFFGVEFFYQPDHGKFTTKLCPAPVTPKFLIKENGAAQTRKKEIHFTRHTHRLLPGWLISQTLGFWSALQLFVSLFRPRMTAAAASSLRHMDQFSQLTVECTHPEHHEHGLQVGFTVPEMIQRVEAQLRSIGLIDNFSPLVYVVGHGSSSINNPHYAAYDCGACSGRPGSVNARVFCFMANHPKVREGLELLGIHIPAHTRFVGGLHDTTRDETLFYDEEQLSPAQTQLHQQNLLVFEKALDANAKERARRFELVNKKMPPHKVHEQMRLRSVSLFEPRPELNHATNALCVVGRRSLTRGLFLDRRSFLNSYNYQIDPEGNYLFNILKAVAPVCGGINLEYYFSRVDNQKLGAGTKLPHNVMGLIGVANGIDGDLRPGLPSQMIEVHDPVRLLVIVEHFPDVVLKAISQNADTYQWFANNWVHLVAVHPLTRSFYIFKNETFVPLSLDSMPSLPVRNLELLLEQHADNFPVYMLQNLN